MLSCDGLYHKDNFLPGAGNRRRNFCSETDALVLSYRLCSHLFPP